MTSTDEWPCCVYEKTVTFDVSESFFALGFVLHKNQIEKKIIAIGEKNMQ